MQASRMLGFGLWLLGLGNLAWLVVNAGNALWVNLATNVVIVAGCALAAGGLAAALEGLPGRWKVGLLATAAGHFAQNLLNALDGLAFPDEWVLFAVMAAAVLLAVGAWRWQEDGWDPEALPWLVAGFAGFALEPLYYGLRYWWSDPWQGGYTPGIVIVLAGCVLAALGSWKARQTTAP